MPHAQQPLLHGGHPHRRPLVRRRLFGVVEALIGERIEVDLRLDGRRPCRRPLVRRRLFGILVEILGRRIGQRLDGGGAYSERHRHLEAFCEPFGGDEELGYLLGAISSVWENGRPNVLSEREDYLGRFAYC
jgi:hypothetical protein